MVLKSNIMDECPGGFCDYIQQYSEAIVIILCIEGFIFFVTLLPPLFSWANKKPDGKKRIYFAALACLTFYFWLAFLAVNSLYCFGFLAHHGPCKSAKFALKFEAANVTAIPSGKPPTAFPESSLENPLKTSPASLVADNGLDTTLPAAMALTSKKTSASSKNPSRLNEVYATSIEASPSSSSFLTSSSMSSSSIYSSKADQTTRLLMEAAAAKASTPGGTPVGVSGFTAFTASQPPMVVAPPQALISWSSDNVNKSCVQQPANEHETQLKNLTLVNILILVVLFIVFIANAKEVMSAKALYHKETLCKKEEVQRFLSSLVLKPPEVGHLINCFHIAKLTSDTKAKKANIAAAATSLKKSGKGGPPRKVITFSAIENFKYQTWRDFSDLRLIEPSATYPIIEIEIVLNFFPGDHYTAERYKAFVNQMTKEHSGKDARITIDDYFHVEDHREWTFFIGNEKLIQPWWDKDVAKVLLSSLFLWGWPFRMSYGGRIAKHQVEVKKAVFVENNSNDEGVSLSATPGSGGSGGNATAEEKSAVASAANNPGDKTPDSTTGSATAQQLAEGGLATNGSSSAVAAAAMQVNDSDADIIEEPGETEAMLRGGSGNRKRSGGVDPSLPVHHNNPAPPPPQPIDQQQHVFKKLGANEHRVNAVVSNPPKEQQITSANIMQTSGHNPPMVGVSQMQVDAIVSNPPPGSAAADPLHQFQLQQQQQQQQLLLQQQQRSKLHQQQPPPVVDQHQHFYQQMQIHSGPSLPTTYATPASAAAMMRPHHPAFGHPLAHVLPTQGNPLQQVVQVPQRHSARAGGPGGGGVPPDSGGGGGKPDPVITAVTHQDINGMTAANTVAVKDMDMQMTALSGYETYV